MIQNLVRDVTALGGSFFYFVLVILAFFVEKWSLGMQLLLGYICIHIIAIPIRFLFFRVRPKPRSTYTLIQKIDAASFPSLHASRASFLGLFFIRLWGMNALGVIIFLLACATLWSRYYLQEHHMGDILTGALLGAAISFLVPYIA